ncbi:MAG TPA: hypothetical protein VKU84_04980 [Stellaceae bacterium]|nr:hypothetical protein [Stellaceae bacterium]
MIDWILGLFMAVLAVLGLVLAAGAYDTGMYTFGLSLFAFGIFFDFWLVKKAFDAKEEQAAGLAVAAPEIKAAAD